MLSLPAWAEAEGPSPLCPLRKAPPTGPVPGCALALEEPRLKQRHRWK